MDILSFAGWPDQKDLGGRIDRLYKLAGDDDAFNPQAFRRALGGIRASVSRLR